MFKPLPTKSRSNKAIVLLTVAALLLSIAPPMWAATNPIPGVDVVVRKHPGATMVVATTNAKGQFSGRVTEAGQYSISIVCKTAPCPRFTVTLSANGKVLKANADKTYNLTVEDRKLVMLTGAVMGSGGVGVQQR